MALKPCQVFFSRTATLGAFALMELPVQTQ